MHTTQGHIAVGWLIVEDIFTVLVLVVLPAAAVIVSQGGDNGPSIPLALGLAVVRIAALSILVLGGGKRLIPWLLRLVAQTRSRELFTLSVLALALAIATGSAYFFGVSMALGAFWPGWWSDKRKSATKRPPTLCLCGMLSPCCSSCRWECCSTRMRSLKSPSYSHCCSRLHSWPSH